MVARIAAQPLPSLGSFCQKTTYERSVVSDVDTGPPRWLYTSGLRVCLSIAGGRYPLGFHYKPKVLDLSDFLSISMLASSPFRGSHGRSEEHTSELQSP